MTGIILAGGRSSRMGRDKSTLPWETSDLLNVIIEKLGTVCDDLIVVSNVPRDIKRKEVRVVADIFSQMGPLGGIHAGLCHARHQYAFVTGCDMPYLVPDAVRYLLEEVQGWDIAIPSQGEYYEPLFSCYSKSCLPNIELLLNKSVRRIAEILKLMRYKAIDWENFRRFDPELKLFTNINTEEDYKQASDK